MRGTHAYRGSMTSGSMNRLADETSPYLRQHADNPVDWYPWGDEAFAAARAEDKPILLSVGYSACHWCHVMAHESFEDPETAGGDERAVRQREGRPGGAARRRRHLHGGGAGHDRPRRLAHDRVPHARRPARSSAAPTSRRPAPGRHARLRAAVPGASTRRGGTGATTSTSRPSSLTEAIGERSHLAAAAAGTPSPAPRSSTGATDMLARRFDAGVGRVRRAPQVPPDR